MGLYRKSDALEVCTQTTPYTYDLGTPAGYMLFQDATWTPDPSNTSNPGVTAPVVVTLEFWVLAKRVTLLRSPLFGRWPHPTRLQHDSIT